MTDATEKKDEAKAKPAPAAAPTERETSAEYADKWPDNAPNSVKEYEELRANPPESQKDLTPKPE
jgi:hypothetical protein